MRNKNKNHKYVLLPGTQMKYVKKTFILKEHMKIKERMLPRKTKNICNVVRAQGPFQTTGSR